MAESKRSRTVEARKRSINPKSYRSIALFCSLYKLLERMVLTRLQCKIEHTIIPQQAGFRLGKSCCTQVIILTQHIEDGFELGRIISPPQIRRTVHSQNERTKQLTDQRHRLHHHQPVKGRLHSRNSFTSTSQYLLCMPAEARVAKWQEHLEQTDSNLKSCNVHPKVRFPSGHTLSWREWRTANRVRSGQAATPTATHMWGYRESKNYMCGAATYDMYHIKTRCTHFGERPSVDDIEDMNDGHVRWLSAIADTT